MPGATGLSGEPGLRGPPGNEGLRGYTGPKGLQYIGNFDLFRGPLTLVQLYTNELNLVITKENQTRKIETINMRNTNLFIYLFTYDISALRETK